MNIVRSALRDIRGQWIRYSLTSITMLIGVIGVVGVATINSVAGDMLVAQQEQLNGREASYANSVTLSVQDVGVLDSLYSKLRARIGPRNVSVVFQAETSMETRTTSQRDNNLPGRTLSIEWVQGNLNSVQRLPVVRGSDYYSTSYPPSIELNQVAASLPDFASSEPYWISTPGAEGVRFVTTGTVADGQIEARAYGSLSALRVLFPGELTHLPVQIRVSGPGLDLPSAKSLLSVSSNNVGLKLDGDTHRVDTVQSVRDQVSFLSAVFAACAALVLLVASVGIANVGIASVSERSREFVIRRALGARRRDIFLQVMAASVTAGVVTAVIAVVLEVGAVYFLLPRLISVSSSVSSPAFPALACILGTVVALGTSAIGAILPAIKATRLEVALALRE